MKASANKFDRFERMKQTLIILSSIVLLAGCLKENEIPPIPSISFNSIQSTATGIEVWVDFKDGDGNFGLDDGDTTGVFDDCLRQFNMYLIYQEKQNGVWVDNGDAIPGSLDPCVNENAVPFFYRVPWAKPTGQDQSQQGTIKLAMTTYFLPSDFDTCRFQIQIIDRDLQESNIIYSDEFLKP